MSYEFSLDFTLYLCACVRSFWRSHSKVHVSEYLERLKIETEHLTERGKYVHKIEVITRELI